MTNILSRNSKTRCSLNFPAPETCSSACLVKDICYAQKGRFAFGNVKEANTYRLRLWQRTPAKFWSEFEREIDRLLRRSIKHLRIFGSGDSPHPDFFLNLLGFIKRQREMEFWISTVKYKHNPSAPRNVLIRNSVGIEPYTSAVWRKGKPEPEDGFICPATTGKVKDCDECGHKCWSRDVKHVWYKEH